MKSKVIAPEAICFVTGTYGGRFVVEPLNRAQILPTGLALFATPQPIKPDSAAELQRGFDRYETLRKLNPRQFAELYTANLQGHNFDDLVDSHGITLKKTP